MTVELALVLAVAVVAAAGALLVDLLERRDAGIDPTCCWTCEGRGWVDQPDDLCDDPSCDAAPGEEI